MLLSGNYPQSLNETEFAIVCFLFAGMAGCIIFLFYLAITGLVKWIKKKQSA